jgi:exodeoxyribonuclease VII small subunit
MAKSSDSSEPVNFEKELGRLEQIVEKLEAGALGLDESIRLYEEGAKCLKACQARLAQAEARIKMLVEGAGGTELKDFDAAAANAPEGPEKPGGQGAAGAEDPPAGEKPRRARPARGRGLF